MSKASEWAKHQQLRPTTKLSLPQGDKLVALVTNDGGLGLCNGKKKIELRPMEALSLANWIISNFGPSPWVPDKDDILLGLKGRHL